MCVKVNNLFACGVRVKPIFGTAFHKKGLLVLVNMSSHSLALSNTGGRQKTRSACPPAAAGYRIGFIPEYYKKYPTVFSEGYFLF